MDVIDRDLGTLRLEPASRHQRRDMLLLAYAVEQHLTHLGRHGSPDLAEWLNELELSVEQVHVGMTFCYTTMRIS